MTTDPGTEIRRLFAKAVLEHAAARNLDGDGWAAYRTIQADHVAQVRDAERRFHLEYQTRFEVARKRIVDEGGIKDMALSPRWSGADKFDAAAIDRQAHREVRHRHNGLLAGMDSRRVASLNKLFAGDGQQRDAGERINPDFIRAAERQAGQERRRGPAR